jgi:hypothetical protein
MGAGTDLRAGTITLINTLSTTGLAGFFRWYDNVLPLGSPPPKLAVDVADRGNLLNIEFNNSFVDSSPQNITLTGTGGSYADMPTYLPTCSASSASTDPNVNPLLLGPVLRAGAVNFLDGSGSSPNDGNLTLSYSWNVISFPEGASAPVITGATVSPTIEGLVFGRYGVALRVEDSSGNSATCQSSYGSVATAPNGSLILPPSAPAWLPTQIRQGLSAWPYLDNRAVKFVGIQNQKIREVFSGQNYTPDWNTSLGTITLTNGSATATTSTDVRAALCAGGSSVSAAHSLIAWTSANDRREPVGVASCTGPTTLNIGGAWSGATQTVNYSVTACNSCWLSLNGGGNFGYYDTGLTQYLAWLRTGHSIYLDAFRAWTDRWWISPWIDKGRVSNQNRPFPRGLSLISQFIRAHDLITTSGDYTRLNELDAFIIPADCGNPSSEVREDAYECMFLALDAMLQPAGARKTSLFGTLAAGLAGYTSARQTGGWWGNFAAAGSSWNGNITGTYTVTNNVASISVSGGGGDWPLANGTEMVFCSAGARTSCDPVGYTLSNVTAISADLDRPYEGTTRSTTNIASNKYQQIMGFGVQPFQLGITAIAMGIMSQAFDSVADTTNAALSRQYLSEASNFVITDGTDRPPGRGLAEGVRFAGCSLPLEDKCTGGDQSGRALVSEAGYGVAYAELLAPSSTRRAIFDDMTASIYGLTTPCPDCDGTALNLLLDAEAYWNVGGKWNNFFFGLGFSHTWDAARVGGTGPEDTKTVTIAFVPVAGATSVTANCKSPSGLTSSVSCGLNSCSLPRDWRQGNYLCSLSHTLPNGTNTTDLLPINAQ